MVEAQIIALPTDEDQSISLGNGGILWPRYPEDAQAQPRLSYNLCDRQGQFITCIIPWCRQSYVDQNARIRIVYTNQIVAGKLIYSSYLQGDMPERYVPWQPTRKIREWGRVFASILQTVVTLALLALVLLVLGLAV